MPVEATVYARRTLADADQSVTPPVIPTYSIDLRLVPDLFLANDSTEGVGSIGDVLWEGTRRLEPL